MNIKGIPYKTVWVEYPDIEALGKKLGFRPTVPVLPDGSGPLYTLPCIYDPNTKSTIVDSADIVTYLEKTYPSASGPTLIPDGTDVLHSVFENAFSQAVVYKAIMVMNPVAYEVLSPRAQEYFYRTRKAWFGVPLDQLPPKGSAARREAWGPVRAGFSTVAQWLPADKDGKERLLFGGDKIIYADLIVASFLTWMHVLLGDDNEEWQDILTWDGGRWARFFKLFESYGAADAGTKLEEA